MPFNLDQPWRLRPGDHRCLLAGLALAVSLVACTCRRQRFPSRGDAAAVVVIAPHRDAAAPPRLAEQEPNDKSEEAQTLSTSAEWTVIGVEGSLLDSGKDVDTFKFVVPAGKEAAPAAVIDASPEAEDPRAHARRLNLEATAEGGRGLSLQLLDEGLKAMTTIALEPGESAGLPNEAVLPSHTYYIRVSNPSGKRGKPAEPQTTASGYRLSLQLGDFEIADEREPNDSRETATPVTLLGTAEAAGYHGWQRDSDVFRIPSPAVLSVLDVEIDGVEGVGASLQVQDGNGERLALARGRKGERLALRNVLVKPSMPDAGPTSRFVYVVVRAETGSNRDHRYVVRMSLGAPRLDAEAEPNDSVANATPVEDGTLSGYLPVGDVDYFRYTGDGPREVTFEWDCPARVRGRLEVLRPGVAEPAQVSAAKKARRSVVIAGVPTQGQPLILRLSQPRGDGNANDAYTLKVSSRAAAPIGPGATNVSPPPAR